MSDAATMHVDGAARGNPGPAAYAVVIARDGRPPVEESDTLGTATNNVAEYTALVRGLELAGELGVRTLAVFSDSELMVKQMGGEYRVKSPELQSLYAAAKRLADGFDGLTITHVRRAGNARADALCNEALDGRPSPRGGAAPVAAPPSPARPTAESTATVRDDALECLATAARHWAAHGLDGLPVEAVWDELWSLLDDAGLIAHKKKAGGRR